MNRSASAYFPFESDLQNNCLKRAETIEDTLLSAIRIFLLTRKGSRVGNPKGSSLIELKFQLIPDSAINGLQSQIMSELTNQFQGVTFISVILTKSINTIQSTSDLICKITFTSPWQNEAALTELLITLPSVFAPGYYLSN